MGAYICAILLLLSLRQLNRLTNTIKWPQPYNQSINQSVTAYSYLTLLLMDKRLVPYSQRAPHMTGEVLQAGITETEKFVSSKITNEIYI